MRLDNNAGLDSLIRRLEAKLVQQRTEIRQLQKIVAKRIALTQTITRD